jgi:hypothetical protein
MKPKTIGCIFDLLLLLIALLATYVVCKSAF